jgi:HSP20 family protein
MLYRATLTAPVFGLRRQIDRLFEDTFGRGHAGQSDWSPAVDIRETREELAFEVELPGIAPEDVEVTAEHGILTVRGERTEEWREGDEGRYHLIERGYGSFTRSFQLPQGVDEERIEGDFEHGLLRVRIPKAALPQPRKIQIKAAVPRRTPPVAARAAGTRPRKWPRRTSRSDERRWLSHRAARDRGSAKRRGALSRAVAASTALRFGARTLCS